MMARTFESHLFLFFLIKMDDGNQEYSILTKQLKRRKLLATIKLKSRNLNH